MALIKRHFFLSNQLGDFIPFALAGIIGMMITLDFSDRFLPLGLLILSFIVQFGILFWYLKNHFGESTAAKMVGSNAVDAIVVGIVI